MIALAEQPIAEEWHYPANMPTHRITTMQALAENVRSLMERDSLTQKQLAKRAGVSQRTISNVLNASHETGIETVDRIAAVWGLQGWELQMRNLPPELLGTGILRRTVGALTVATPKGREMIAELAEREAHYSKIKP
jgi:DNA transposition AAA+ family ATPase